VEPTLVLDQKRLNMSTPLLNVRAAAPHDSVPASITIAVNSSAKYNCEYL